MIIAEHFQKPDGIYALSHSVGPLTNAAQEALSEHYLKAWSTFGGDAWPSWLAQTDEFCENIGKVINASAHEICPQNNLAAGFHSFLTAVAKRKGRSRKRVILMHKDAFASMGFVVEGIAETFNLQLHLVDADPNDLAAWHEAFREQNVLACLITHVHSNTSVKSDVKAIAKIAKQCEAYVCVDIAQSVGIVSIDLTQWNVDAVFGSCVKWLCGGPGAGFMYINDALIKQLQPDPVGWFSHQNPFEFDITHYSPANSAKRFWGGTPSIAPYVIANASIKTLLTIGLDNLAEHNLHLKETLVKNLPDHKVFDHVKQNYENLGGSLCIGSIDKLHTRHKLNEANIKFDERDGIFRISMHVINTSAEASLIATCFSFP